MEIKLLISGMILFSVVLLIVCIRIYEIGKFVNERKIDEIFQTNIKIYDFYKETCRRYGATPKRGLSINEMLKESKHIIESKQLK